MKQRVPQPDVEPLPPPWWLHALAIFPAIHLKLVMVGRSAYLQYVALTNPDGPQAVGDYISPGFGFFVLGLCMPGLAALFFAILYALSGWGAREWKLTPALPSLGVGLLSFWWLLH